MSQPAQPTPAELQEKRSDNYERSLMNVGLEDRLRVLDHMMDELQLIVVEAVKNDNESLDRKVPELLESYKLERKLILRILQK